MSILLCEPEYLKINNFKATSANDIIPKNIINDFTTIMNINVDMITLRSTLLELFGTVLEGIYIILLLIIIIVIIIINLKFRKIISKSCDYFDPKY